MCPQPSGRPTAEQSLTTSRAKSAIIFTRISLCHTTTAMLTAFSATRYWRSHMAVHCNCLAEKGAHNDTVSPKKTSNSGRSWVRLRQTLNPKDTTLFLDRKVDPDWEPGDRIVVTTTDYLPGHSEQLEICSVRQLSNNSVTVKTPGSWEPAVRIPAR